MAVTVNCMPALGGFKLNSAAEGFDLERDHPVGFAEFYRPLHRDNLQWPT